MTATDEVGDEAEAIVGLLDDTDTKNRSTGQAGSYGEKDGELSYNQILIVINWVDAHE